MQYFWEFYRISFTASINSSPESFKLIHCDNSISNQICNVPNRRGFPNFNQNSRVFLILPDTLLKCPEMIWCISCVRRVRYLLQMSPRIGSQNPCQIQSYRDFAPFKWKLPGPVSDTNSGLMPSKSGFLSAIAGVKLVFSIIISHYFMFPSWCKALTPML